MNHRGPHVVVAAGRMMRLVMQVRMVIVIVVIMPVMIFVVIVVVMLVMSVMMMLVPMMPAAQQPHAGHVHCQAQARDRDRLAERDRHGRQQPLHRFIADQQRNHRQHDRAGEPRQIAELARAEGEPRIAHMPLGIAIRQRRQQQRAGMGGHVQPIGHQRDRAEQPAATDLGHHHRHAQGDHRPGSPLGMLMAGRKKDVVVD